MGLGKSDSYLITLSPLALLCTLWSLEGQRGLKPKSGSLISGPKGQLQGQRDWCGHSGSPQGPHNSEAVPYCLVSLSASLAVRDPPSLPPRPPPQLMLLQPVLPDTFACEMSDFLCLHFGVVREHKAGTWLELLLFYYYLKYLLFGCAES